MRHHIVIYGPCGRCGTEHAWEGFGGLSFDEELAVAVGHNWLMQFPLDIVMVVSNGGSEDQAGSVWDSESGPYRPRSLDLREGCP